MWWLIVLVAANACLAIAWIIRNRKRVSHPVLKGLFFIVVPWFGFLFYYLPRWANKRQTAAAAPVAENPVSEDPFAGPGNTEAERTRDLKQLRKNLDDNYRFLLVAEKDKEMGSEPYYSVAAKEEAYRADKAMWEKCQQAFGNAPDDPDAFHAASRALLKLMNSDAPSGPDLAHHRTDFVRLVQSELDRHPDVVTPTEYEECLRALINEGSYTEAEGLWNKAAPRLRTEPAYQDMLAMYYKLQDRQKFQRVLDDLRNNDDIRVSSTGREQMKYWSKRLANAA